MKQNKSDLPACRQTGQAGFATIVGLEIFIFKEQFSNLTV